MELARWSFWVQPNPGSGSTFRQQTNFRMAARTRLTGGRRVSSARSPKMWVVRRSSLSANRPGLSSVGPCAANAHGFHQWACLSMIVPGYWCPIAVQCCLMRCLSCRRHENPPATAVRTNPAAPSAPSERLERRGTILRPATGTSTRTPDRSVCLAVAGFVTSVQSARLIPDRPNNLHFTWPPFTADGIRGTHRLLLGRDQGLMQSCHVP